MRSIPRRRREPPPALERGQRSEAFSGGWSVSERWRSRASARWYDERVQAGGWLVTVQAPGRFEEARSILHEFGGHDYERGRMGYRDWSETQPEFRSSYERQYGTSGRWEDVEPSYRFGYEAYGRDRDRYRDWRTAEPDLEREWSARGAGSWEEHRDRVRRGYDYARGRRRFRD